MILQIANGYFQSKLYRELFNSLEQLDVKNKVYVPLKYGENYKEQNVICDECFSLWNRLSFFGKQKKIVRSIIKKIGLNEISVIHAHTLFSSGYAAYQLNKQFEIPYVVAIRNTDVNVFLKHFYLFRRIGLDIMNNSSKIIFLSSSYKNNVIKKYIPKQYANAIEEKIQIIPNGIEEVFIQEHYSEKSLGKEIKLVYIGDINKNKNIETIIDALNVLREKKINATLDIVGPIIERKYWDDLEKNDYVKYLGTRDVNGVINILRKSDVFVMLSHLESFGLVYAEAISQGVPVVYTRGQGFDEQFDDGVVGYAASDKNPVEVADKIVQIINNYDEIRKNCFHLAHIFSWPEIAYKYKKIYEEVRGK